MLPSMKALCTDEFSRMIEVPSILNEPCSANHKANHAICAIYEDTAISDKARWQHHSGGNGCDGDLKVGGMGDMTYIGMFLVC